MPLITRAGCRRGLPRARMREWGLLDLADPEGARYEETVLARPRRRPAPRRAPVAGGDAHLTP
jgi:hypothetical protein